MVVGVYHLVEGVEVRGEGSGEGGREMGISVGLGLNLSLDLLAFWDRGAGRRYVDME